MYSSKVTKVHADNEFSNLVPTVMAWIVLAVQDNVHICQQQNSRLVEPHDCGYQFLK